MTILAAIRREEKKAKKQLAKLQHDLIGLQSVAKVLGKTASRDIAREETRAIGQRQSKDLKGYERTLGKGQGTS